MANIFAILAAVVHVLFFLLESILFKGKIGKAVFRMSDQQIEHCELFAFNQGFYNLFLSVGLFVGVMLPHEVGAALKMFCLISMYMAGIVLFFSDRRLWRGTLIQSVLPLLALLFMGLGK